MATINGRRAALQARVEKACRLMVETDLSLAEVALEAGFSSQAHMNAAFRKVRCCTPRQCRIACRCRKVGVLVLSFMVAWGWSEEMLLAVA